MQAEKVCTGGNGIGEPPKSAPKFSARYLGSMSVSRLYSQTVQPWVMAEIRRKRENVQDVLIEVSGENLLVHKLKDKGQQLLFQQNLKGVTRFAKMHQDAKCFAYLTRYEITADFQCHVYQTDSETMIPELFKAIRDASQGVLGKPGGVDPSAQPPVDSKKVGLDDGDSDRCKSLFEVKYLGRAKLGSRRVTTDYIDSLAERLIAREVKSSTEKLEEKEHKRRIQEQQADVLRERHASGASVKSLPDTLEDVAEDLITENRLEEQNEMMGNPGLQSFPSQESSVGSDSVSLEEVEQLDNQHVSWNLEGNSNSNSTKDSKNVTLEQNLNSLAKGQEAKVHRPSAKDIAPRRRHSSLTEDKSWSSSKFTFQNPGSDSRQNPDSIESQDSLCSVHRQQEDSRVMVLQIGQQSMCLISLDKKMSVLECKFSDISFVSQGSHKQNLFGIVVRDAGALFFCYILRGLSQAVVEEILSTLQTAFTTACSKRGDNICGTVGPQGAAINQVCPTCPLHQFHKICQEIHTLSSQAAYEVIVKKIHCLPDKEFSELNHLLQAEAPESFEESLEVMMIFLRQLFERKQREHVHITETGKSCSKPDVSLQEEKQSLLEGLKNKAKKSLTTSFEHLLTRSKKKDEAVDTFRQRSWTTDSETSWTSRDSSTTSTPDVSPMSSPMRKDAHQDFPSPPASPGAHRRRSATMDNLEPLSHAGRQLARRRDVNHNTTASPMKTMFLLSTSSHQHSESLSSSATDSPLEDTKMLAPSRRPSSSWRKAIFNKVCTPQHSVELGEESPLADGKLHNTADVRAMWRKLILESLLLIRMEKENQNIRARQEQDGATLCHKLEYQELTPCLKEITGTWEKMLAVNDGDEEEVGRALMEEAAKIVPRAKLLEYVKKGVPRSLRGQIWLFLMQQQQMSSVGPDSSCESASYEDLLKQLTMHQHAILIDLGRTFPSHPYFSKSLGAGQLELFNLLKAYSLLDKEVGYCQGLSFIVGMLLMHMEEISAFHVLKYLMYDLGLRKQFRPNMMALQLKLYQLTRLLHDRHKNVYDYFETHEISPTLYAAPWFLTMFASQFPLGFVARVFDMIFIQGIDALFKVALTLIGSHNALILQCDSFESIVHFLKITLPEMVQVQMERIINQAFELDLDRELQQYGVEYYVLSEEIPFASAQHHQYSLQHPNKGMAPPSGLYQPVERRRSSTHVEIVCRLENQNLSLKQQNTELLEKLQQAQSQRQSSDDSALTQQTEMDKLKSHIQSLEQERTTLLAALAKLSQLVLPEALQHLHLSLPATSLSSVGLENTSDHETHPSHQRSQHINKPLDQSGSSKLLGRHQATPAYGCTPALVNDVNPSLLSSSPKTASKSSTNPASPACNLECTRGRDPTHNVASSLPGTNATPLHTFAAAHSLTSTSDTTKRQTQSDRTRKEILSDRTGKGLHSDRTKKELLSDRNRISSPGMESLTYSGLSSSSCVTQTCTVRNMTNNRTVDATPPERRQKTVTVVVQQSVSARNPHRPTSSER